MDLVHHLPETVIEFYYQQLAHPAMTRLCGSMPCQGQSCLLWSHPLLLEHLIWGNSRPLLLPDRGNGETTLIPSTLKTLRHLPSSAICLRKKWGWKDFALRLISRILRCSYLPHVFSPEVFGNFVTSLPSPFLPFLTALYFLIRPLCIILPCQKDQTGNLFDKKK